MQHPEFRQGPRSIAGRCCWTGSPGRAARVGAARRPRLRSSRRSRKPPAPVSQRRVGHTTGADGASPPGGPAGAGVLRGRSSGPPYACRDPRRPRRGVRRARGGDNFESLGLDSEVVESSGANAAAAAVAGGQLPDSRPPPGRRPSPRSAGARRWSRPPSLPAPAHGDLRSCRPGRRRARGSCRSGPAYIRTTRRGHEFTAFLGIMGVRAEDVETVAIDGPEPQRGGGRALDGGQGSPQLVAHHVQKGPPGC